MKWLEDALDSYGWLEMCFFADEEMILDELTKLEPEIDWTTTLDAFTSADFQDEYTVVFTIYSDFPVSSRIIEGVMRKAFHNLYEQWVAITVLRL